MAEYNIVYFAKQQYFLIFGTQGSIDKSVWIIVWACFDGIIPLFDTRFDGIIPLFNARFDGIIPLSDTRFNGIIPLFDTRFDGIIPLKLV